MTNRTEVQQLRAENDEPAYVVEYADGRPSTEHAAGTTARNCSNAGVEARVRHDGALVRTHGWGRRADGTPVGPRMRIRF